MENWMMHSPERQQTLHPHGKFFNLKMKPPWVLGKPVTWFTTHYVLMLMELIQADVQSSYYDSAYYWLTSILRHHIYYRQGHYI
jgi:hypothetical protein